MDCLVQTLCSSFYVTHPSSVCNTTNAHVVSVAYKDLLCFTCRNEEKRRDEKYGELLQYNLWIDCRRKERVVSIVLHQRVRVDRSGFNNL